MGKMCIPPHEGGVQGIRVQGQQQDNAPTGLTASKADGQQQPEQIVKPDVAKAAEKPTGQTAAQARKQQGEAPECTDLDTLVMGVGTALAQMASMAQPNEAMTCFHSVRPPAMSISAYLDRIKKFFGCSEECYVIGLLYIDRLIKLHPRICVSPLSGHRLLLMGMTLAAKFHDDRFYSNAFYAKVGGLTLKEFNMLESRFVHLLDWKFHIRPDEYELYHDIVLKAAAAGTSNGGC